MYYVVSVNQNGMVAYLSRSDCEGFKKCKSNTWDEIDDDVLWNDSEKDRNVTSVRKMKAVTVKMATVTLIGTGR
jgi:uncharacterized protein YehS (DUF1456 family)